MTLSQSILATLTYHDIFDYPLTQQEIHNYLINLEVRAFTVKRELNKLFLTRKLVSKNGYIFLRGRSKIVKLRKLREKYSLLKIKRAQFFARILKVVPSLKLVAISGALAMENSHKNDDIDLVLITSKNTLWTTRFLANILLLPYKRSPSGRQISDRACLNVFIDESQLKIGPPNLYLAHEICQMKPLWDRDGTYRRFLSANKWIKKYLPNWRPEEVQSQSRKSKSKSNFFPLSTFHFPLAENFLKSFQLLYMRPKITTEQIGDHQLFFHPADTQKWVIAKYKRRLRKLRITSS